MGRKRKLLLFRLDKEGKKDKASENNAIMKSHNRSIKK